MDDPRLAGLLQQLIERLKKVPDLQVFQFDFVLGRWRLNRHARVLHGPLPGRFTQRMGGVFESLVFEKLSDQFESRILEFLIVVEGGRTGKQGPRLDFHQCGGQHEKLADDFRVDLLEESDVLQILFGDTRDGNVEDVDLFPLDQKEQ